MARPDKSYLEKQTSRRNPPKKKTLGESSVDSRMAKISFKNYLRQIEEELLDEDDDVFEEDKKLPSNTTEVDDLYDEFIAANEDLLSPAREKGAEDGTEFMLDELKAWLERKGFSAGEIETWIESDMGQEMHDSIWNGLT